jgi:hypothetical protein
MQIHGRPKVDTWKKFAKKIRKEERIDAKYGFPRLLPFVCQAESLP